MVPTASEPEPGRSGVGAGAGSPAGAATAVEPVAGGPDAALAVSDAGGLAQVPPSGAEVAVVQPGDWSVAVPGTRLRLGVTLVLALVVAVAALVWGVLTGEIGGGREAASGSDGPATSAVVAVIAVGSVLVHEGAHAVAAQTLGYRVEWVVLGLLDGKTSYSGRSDRPLDRAAIAMAGPAASAAVVLVLLAAWAAGFTGPGDAVLAGVWFNIATFVLNLVPVAGSDGRYVLTGLVEDRRRRSPRQR